VRPITFGSGGWDDVGIRFARSAWQVLIGQNSVLPYYITMPMTKYCVRSMLCSRRSTEQCLSGAISFIRAYQEDHTVPASSEPIGYILEYPVQSPCYADI
jgi:hypothetical protein